MKVHAALVGGEGGDLKQGNGCTPLSRKREYNVEKLPVFVRTDGQEGKDGSGPQRSWLQRSLCLL